MMDSRTRVEAALALEVADRPPAAWWGHTFLEEWSPANLAEITIERARRFKWDFVKFQPRASCFAEAFGAKYLSSGNAAHAPVPAGRLVNIPDDWVSLSVVEPRALQDQVEAIGQVAAALGSSVPVIQTVFSPLSVAAFCVGADKQRAVEAMRAEPDLLAGAFKRMQQVLAEFSAASIQAGAAGIFYAISGYASSDCTSEDEYERFALHHDRSILESLPPEAWFNVLHLCGSNLHFDLAMSLPVQAVSWSVQDKGNPSLAQGRDSSGKAVMGGLARHDTLAHGSPQEVIRQGHEAIAETGGRGLLLAPGCSVPVDAPETNLAAMANLFSGQ